MWGDGATRAVGPGTPRVHKRVTIGALSCREIRIAASHKSREIGAEIRIPRSPLSPEQESGQKSELPVYCFSRSPAGITLTNLSSKSAHVQCCPFSSFCHSWTSTYMVGDRCPRFVKCRSLNTCQNNKMTNDKFKLVKTPPHGQKPSEVFV